MLMVSYLKGVDEFGSRFTIIPLTLLAWTFSATAAFVLEYSRSLCIPQRNSIVFRSLFVAPALIQISQNIINLTYPVWAYRELLSFMLWFFDAALAIIGVLLLHSAYKSRAALLNSGDPNAASLSVATNEVEQHEAVLANLLGRGNGYIDRVILSVIDRSFKSERMATFSLIIMLILVLIGGMASFGLWAFTHADRISSIEAERNKLTVLQAEMQEIKERLGSSNEATAKLDQLLRFVDQNYKTSPSYEATLNRLSQQSQSNYADIAIRVTIAVLTIFLVQVFFAVYKYNRHLAILLSAKAEALELVGNDDDARKELSREAVSIIKETVPGFASHPRTPIEEISRLADKVRR